jgi:hypothetical protein
MCTGVEIAMLGAAAAGTAASVNAAEQGRKAGNQQRESMLRAESERKNAEALAAQRASMMATDRRRRAGAQSLLTSGAQGPITSALSAGGKATLGA